MKSPSNNLIALMLAIFGGAIVMYVFFASRSDPGLRMAALVAATSTGAALVAIASTLLTGKDLTKNDPSALPPGSVVANSSTVQTPPITAPPASTLPPKGDA